MSSWNTEGQRNYSKKINVCQKPNFKMNRSLRELDKDRKRKRDIQFSSFQLLSHVQFFATPRTTAGQASLSITNSWSPPKSTSIESVMPSSHLILCCPLILLPSIFPSISVFSNESALRIRWLKYWSFSFNIILPTNTQDWSPLGWTGWISLQSKGVSRVFSNTTIQKHPFFGTQLSW